LITKKRKKEKKNTGNSSRPLYSLSHDSTQQFLLNEVGQNRWFRDIKCDIKLSSLPLRNKSLAYLGKNTVHMVIDG